MSAEAFQRAGGTHDVPDGQVLITPQLSGRFLVEIGRSKYVKRINFSRAEATQLAGKLNELL